MDQGDRFAGYAVIELPFRAGNVSVMRRFRPHPLGWDDRDAMAVVAREPKQHRDSRMAFAPAGFLQARHLRLRSRSSSRFAALATGLTIDVFKKRR